MKTLTHLQIGSADAVPSSKDLTHAVSQFQDGCSVVSGLVSMDTINIPDQAHTFTFQLDAGVSLTPEQNKELILLFEAAEKDPMGGVVATQYGIHASICLL